MKEESTIVDAEIVDEAKSQTTSEPQDANNNLKTNLLNVDHWIRGVFMLLLAIVASVASYVVGVVVIVQFLFALITGKPEERLVLLGSSLTQYIRQILAFLTFNSEQKPFPFADWPSPTKSEANHET